MSLNVSFDIVLNPLIGLTNVGVNQLTNLYMRFNPKGSDSTFHYNTKTTIFNGATVLLALQASKMGLGKSSIRGSVFNIVMLLFIRTIVDHSMSTKDSGIKAAKGWWHQLIGQETIESLFADSNAKAASLLAQAKTPAGLSSNLSWKENLWEIQRYPVLKNWVSA